VTGTVKVNLDKTLTSLKLVSIVAGALIACAVVYARMDDRIDSLEQKQATFEGVMEERTRNTNDRVNDIYDIIKDWGPVSGNSKKEN